MSSSFLLRFHFRAILLPYYRGPGLVVAKIGLGAPVAVNRVAICGFIEVDVETAVVGGIGGRAATVYYIVGNGGAGLGTEGVDASRIVELEGKIPDGVAVYAIVAHAGVVAGPSPAYTNARVVDAVYCVVGYFHIPHITAAYTHTPPVFIGGIGDTVVGDTDALSIADVILGQWIRMALPPMSSKSLPSIKRSLTPVTQSRPVEAK